MVRFSVRQAVADDADAIARCHHLGWVDGYRGMVRPGYLASLSQQACTQRWRDHFRDTNPATSQFVAEAAGCVIGFVSIGPCLDPDAPKATEVWDLWVLPGHRNEGVGARLLEAALDELAADGSQVAVLWVLRENLRARAFYERQGGVSDGMTRHAPYERGGVIDVRYLFDLRGRAIGRDRTA